MLSTRTYTSTAAGGIVLGEDASLIIRGTVASTITGGDGQQTVIIDGGSLTTFTVGSTATDPDINLGDDDDQLLFRITGEPYLYQLYHYGFPLP